MSDSAYEVSLSIARLVVYGEVMLSTGLPPGWHDKIGSSARSLPLVSLTRYCSATADTARALATHAAETEGASAQITLAYRQVANEAAQGLAFPEHFNGTSPVDRELVTSDSHD